MGTSSRLLKKEPKSNSFLLSFLGYAFLLLIAIVISNKNSDSKPEEKLSIQEKKTLIRENKPHFSISRYSAGLPNTPLILGIYQSGNDTFYHQFKGLAENYSMTKNVNFAMINIKVIEEMNIFDEMRIKKIVQNFNLDDVPTVMFIYQNIEIEKLRMSLGFTNLGDQELKKRIEGLINFTIKPQTTP
jgi:hypothetical protein